MSIDVFGRHSKRAQTASRGPPGIGFKITPEGHYDMDNKRLLNVAEAKEQKDAVNLNLLQRLVQQEMKIIYDVIASLRTEVVNNFQLIDALDNSIKKSIKTVKIDSDALQELVYRNSELITQLDVKLNALKNGRREAAAGEGAA